MRKLTKAFTISHAKYPITLEAINEILHEGTYTLADIIPPDEAYLLIYSSPTPMAIPPGQITQVVARTDARITFTLKDGEVESQYTHPY